MTALTYVGPTGDAQQPPHRGAAGNQGETMNVRLYDGSVRCGEHMDASSYESLTNDPCTYCPQEEDCGFAEVPTAGPEDAETAEWEGHVDGIIATESTRLAPLSGVWSVYRRGARWDDARGYMWPWAAGTAKSLAMASWAHEGDVEIRLNGKRVVWL